MDLLGSGRKDESGDFTKGAGLTEDQSNAILSFILSGESTQGRLGEQGLLPLKKGTLRYPFIIEKFNNVERVEKLRSVFPNNEVFNQGLDELKEIAKLTESFDPAGTIISIDPSVVRGLEYYTGPVYEAELTFETKDEKGNPVRFGSVGGGGRYDGLIARFRAEPVPATGFSIGVSRLMAALKALKKIDDKPEFGPVVVTIFDKDRVADYQSMVKELREANIRAELYLGNPKNFGNQLKYADRRNSPVAVIQGGDELARGEIQIKDLIDGKKAAEAIASNTEWRASRPSQFSVRRDQLVEKVQEVLKRHGIT
jgi:histidyl-tRNA synthetase